MADGKHIFRDRLYVFLLCAAISALAWLWQFETPPPDLMDNLAAAAGLRPPTGQLSLLWHHIAGSICRAFGLSAAESVLRIAGHISLGVFAIMATVLFKRLLPVSFRRGEHVAAWWRVAVRFVLFQGTALFCLSEPVWNAFRWFSPLSLHMLIAAAAVICCMVHFSTNRRAPLFAAFALIGLLSADTPIGGVMLVIVGGCLFARGRLRRIGMVDVPNENPLSNALMAWRLTIAFAFGAIGGLILEIHTFASLDGLAAFGWSWGEYAFRFPLAYIKAFLAECSPAGVVLAVIVAVLPVIIEYRLLARATDDEKHLVYVHGVMFFVFGIVAFTQLAGARHFWFWTWGGESGCLRDGVLKCAAMFLCALSAVWSLAVFTVELHLRSYRRIEILLSQDEAESPGAAEAFAMARRLQRMVRTCLLVEPLVAFACVLPFRPQSLERAMLGVVADAAHETAEECRGAEYVFTDGGLDAAVELAAAEEGESRPPLYALSLMGGATDRREIFLRTRGVQDVRDRVLLESGAADALRTWVRERPDRDSTYAVQIGFELWRRDGKKMPECAGLVARPAGFAPGAAERGAAVARGLARRIISIYGMGDPDSITDRPLRDAFLFAQWRLAVIARHRANAYDERGEGDLAMEETRLADALDGKNRALERIRATMGWASKKRLERMTPQEGLKFGLAQANFALARTFALRVLDVSPDDPAANFALGMDFFVQRQYARAQAYLERCRERRPDDPAVLNNLAQCRLRQGDPAGALPYAKRAQEVLPDSPEIKNTLHRISAALEKKGKGE